MFRTILIAIAALALLPSTLRAQDDPRPRVVETVPEHLDMNVDPGLTEIRVTFDRDMEPTGFSWVGGGSTFPETTAQASWESPRIAVLPVELRPGWYYELSINSDRFQNFRDTLDYPAVPHPIQFCTSLPEGDFSALQPEQNAIAIEQLRTIIDREYSHKGRLDIDWDARFAAFEDRLLKAHIPEAFALVAADLLSVAEDPHLSVSTSNAGFATDNDNPPANIHFGGLVGMMPSLNRGRVCFASWLREDVGYMLIPAWSGNPETFEDLPELLEEFLDADALIIDVRPNAGGNEDLAQNFAGCFILEDTPYAKHVWRDYGAPGGFSTPVTRVMQPADDKPYYDGDVVVLIGPACMSSNEAFILMMQAAGATLVGLPTRGSSANPTGHDLANGVTVVVPRWKAMTLKGVEFEGRGIQPDHRVEATMRELEWDAPVLKKALEVIDAKRESGADDNQ